MAVSSDTRAGTAPGSSDTASAEPPEQDSTLPKGRLIVIFVGLILGILMAALDQTIVATALPTIAGDLNGLEQISWIITVYLLAQTIAMPIYGKVGDIIGRKNAFQIAIVIFLAGSVLAGIAQSMGMLIAFRAVQGIGAGGLMIGAQTIMAEIVSARERGKYMSVMGPMIGVATVLGPLLGGYLTQHVTWRWIFYINVPIGIAAIIVTGIVLKLPKVRRKPTIDYRGVTCMVVAVSCLVLILTWGGRKYDWDSWTIIGLGIGAVVFIPLWLLAERKATEPILPLRLFRDNVFRINSILAFLLGIAMFGAVSYLPTYLQLSLGASATKSGVLMLPLMGGLMFAAVITGQTISRIGRYKFFPIMGTVLAAGGMYLLSLMDATTTRGESSLYMVVLGLGIGFIMPTLVLTVQNSVPRKDMGPATANVNFFRQIGASFGTAIIGSLFISRLTDNLAKNLPPQAAGQIGQHAAGITPEQLKALPDPIAHAFVVSYANALTPLYAYLVPLLVLGFVIAWFLKEKPLTTTLGRSGAAQSPRQDTASREAADPPPPQPRTDTAGVSPETAPVLATPPVSQNGHGKHHVEEPETPAVTGSVYQDDHTPARSTLLTLLDFGGNQLDRTRTGEDGSYRLRPPQPGTYMLVCLPASSGTQQPLAQTVMTNGEPITRDLLLAARNGAAAVDS